MQQVVSKPYQAGDSQLTPKLTRFLGTSTKSWSIFIWALKVSVLRALWGGRRKVNDNTHTGERWVGFCEHTVTRLWLRVDWYGSTRMDLSEPTCLRHVIYVLVGSVSLLCLLTWQVADTGVWSEPGGYRGNCESFLSEASKRPGIFLMQEIYLFLYLKRAFN